MVLILASIVGCNVAGPSAENISRCPNVAPPQDERRVIRENLKKARETYPKEREPASVTITVYFHILTDTSGKGDVTNARVHKQIELLNDAFAGKYGGAATPFKFKLADIDIDRTPNNEWFDMVYLDEPSGAEREAKETLNKGDKSVLNIYTANLSSVVLGWARWPWDYEDGVDGVVIGFRTLPDGNIPHRNQGDTLIHEVGHWLGLFHTFEDGCYGEGDEVDDTAAQSSRGQDCEAEDTCPDIGGFDPVENFMDCSWDECRFLFTRGQSDRMDAMHLAYRK